MTSQREFSHVNIMFAVQAIEAWLLADERTLNDYLSTKNKAKHVNDPETINKPKQIIQNLFQQSHKKYDSQARLDLMPRLSVNALLRCRHFRQLYDCVHGIVEKN